MASESSTKGMQDRGSTDSPRKEQLLDLAQRFRGNTKAMIGLVIVMILVATAIVAPLAIPDQKTKGVNGFRRQARATRLARTISVGTSCPGF